VTHPRIPGHEIVGDVVSVGSGVTRFKVGQRVGSGWHGGHCFNCGNCRAGDFVVCEKEDINGIARDGGYAEFVTLREEAVAVVPDNLDPAEVAPLLCAGVTTFSKLKTLYGDHS
jgi:D-arabinose 1-dehydrogenase-like Zn-dependent alcohol dehydrogenase